MLHYRHMIPHETTAVCHLAAHVFAATAALYFEPHGIAEFLQYLAPHEMGKRLHHEHEVWVAEQAGHIIGMLELRAGNHITLFFVDQAHHGQGIGRHLLATVVHAGRTRNPELAAISVHATPNAVPIYTRLGFVPTADEQAERGMRFVPMVLSLVALNNHAAHAPHHAGKSGTHALHHQP